MKNIAIALCTLSMLAACGERGSSSQTGEKPAPDTAQVQAEVEASQEAATAAIDDARRDREEAEQDRGPVRTADYKRTMLGLIAGSYAGDCSTRSGPVSRGAVTVDADGRISAPGLPARNLMDPDANLTLSIQGADGQPSEITFLGGNDRAQWSVSSQRKGDLTTVYSDRGNPIKCVDSRPPQQGRAANLYQALARHISAGGSTLQCAQGRAEARSSRIVAAGNTLSVGNDTLALDDDANEVATVNAGDGTLTYRRETDGGKRVLLTLNRTGRISGLTVSGYRGANIGSCARAPR
ncbi:hypothetical protein KY495_03835 [Massilia sp. PAMC28688]|uniref:hypothetical protein n=1 Tax=Massilia sp. PAMC28688 TaxID=2861283 RepID=UPI001C6336DB|nr:hypothetical protein [Massilia sp. PAMC28688]QYF94360.1 hypothetical protein KY495_03835 [Massilia sp. PAMC28688]